MTVINPDEISSILKESIKNYENKAEISNIGSVLEVGDGIARIYGLRNVMSNELVEFEDGKGTLGITLNLEEGNVGLTILPIKASPTGTEAILPVVFTVIPSLICVYSPKITTPTLSSSKFKDIPKVPLPSSNSTSSFAITFLKP